MELLTNRLSALMNEVAENQIAELVDKDREQKQRMVEREQRSKMLSYKTTNTFAQFKPQRNTALRGAFGKQRKDKEEKTEQVRKAATLATVWGSKQSKEDKVDKANEKGDKKSFLKVAKLAVLMSSVTQGREICTCESLDAKCKIHDN